MDNDKLTASGFRRSCPWRDPQRDARCVLWTGHLGDHVVRGREEILAREAERHDRIVEFYDGPPSDVG